MKDKQLELFETKESTDCYTFYYNNIICVIDDLIKLYKEWFYDSAKF